MGNCTMLAMEREYVKEEAVRLEVATKVRAAIEAQSLKCETIFAALSRDGHHIARVDLVSFLQQGGCDMEIEKLDHVFFPPSCQPKKEDVDKCAEPEKEGDKKEGDKKEGVADDKKKEDEKPSTSSGEKA